MLAPDSVSLLVVLLLLAGLAVWGATRRGHLLLRVGSGGVALTLAFAAGIAEVNHYFGYYRNWGDLATDLSGGPQVDTRDVAVSTAQTASTAAPVEHGQLVKMSFAGKQSGIAARTGYVWLPPGYPALAARHVQLPVLMLIHGTPGLPVDWISALHVDQVLDIEYAQHRIGPMVVVLAPANATRQQHEECVDAVHGPRDETYVAQDVPADIEAVYSVLPQGASWGIGGFSSGGYCSANLALHRPSSFGAVVDLDGYLHPSESMVAGQLFRSDVAAERANDIVDQLARGVPSPLPAFFLASGTDSEDETDATTLQRLLLPHEAVPLLVEHGGAHTFYTWAAALPAGIDWAWHQLAPPALQREFPTLDAAEPGRADVAISSEHKHRLGPHRGGPPRLRVTRSRDSFEGPVPFVAAPTPAPSGASRSA